ncbi:RNA 2',3'-cyclic phosphodiesterase [Aeoliella mucimassa]|uniref:RNA 2',3'-cyclic phosphodiesterase n=1 Tax=Aeoliella mucimassa TaxID=2527972 RepID=A0A518ANV7_9BACT|nr:RNA 2',3'-cyclic phosphodiesterase [Aeoliella mucimassa]QDU56381.1 2',5' RNA ligase family [Aeoliella mucimassa]
MAKVRTFIAVAPGPEVVERAERALMRLRRLADNVKWVERSNLHWTLHFLGELDDQEVYDVCKAAERAAGEVEAFSMIAEGVGAFPSNSRPRTLWLGAGEGGDGLVDLHAKLEEQLRPLGFRGETRKYVPHLTLGRAGRSLRPAESVALAEDLAKLTDFEGGSQTVEELIVYASRLRREGPEYAALATIPLS